MNRYWKYQHGLQMERYHDILMYWITMFRCFSIIIKNECIFQIITINASIIYFNLKCLNFKLYRLKNTQIKVVKYGQ